MNKRFFAVAWAIGLITVAWVGLGFVGTHWLALAMTVVIGGVYMLGALELRQFRAHTEGLAAALADAGQPASLADWLERVPAPLRQAVRQRIEGEQRSGLPAPALTPYLVGLLVMLGMLGTFLGMVVTFKGAVFALEGSADLQGMRSALAEPIKGLGLSFGTSVAGVAASAMLGLMSALSRRERLDVARQLDARIATVLRPFSPAHQREESLRALQAQAHVLPAVMDRLEGLMARMETRSQQLDAQVVDRQDRFHRDVTQAYTELSRSVGASLQESLAAGARAAGESITPVVTSAMTQIVHESQRLHARLGEAAQAQVDQLSQQFTRTAQSVSDNWTAALQAHERSSNTLTTRLQGTLEAFGQTFEQRSASLVAQMEERLAQSQAQQAESVRGVADTWTAALQAHERSSDAVATRLQGTLEVFGQTFEQRSASLLAQVEERLAQTQAAQAAGEAARLQAWTEALQSMAAQLQGQWQQAGEQAIAQQRAVCAALEQTAAQVAERASEQAGRTMDEAAQLLTRSEELVRSRIATEAEWHEQHGQRMDELASLWRTELQALRQDEAQRGQAAVDRLGALEAAVAQHLATLGAALEAPLSRLLQTASEVPQAAASVIAQLREEMSHLSERDNLALQERSTLLEQLGTLLQSVNQAAGEQRGAIEALVASASSVLEQATGRFAQVLESHAGQAADTATHVSASALELASVGEAFGHSVEVFQATNDKLVDSLQRIESSINRSTARSDEQLAYYVAQAREVIDLSIASQQGLVENLRQLQAKPAKALALAEGERA